MMAHVHECVVAVMLLASLVQSITAFSCPAESFSGFRGPFSTLEHQVSGNVNINGCEVVVSEFTYDGQAPAAYFWCSASQSSTDMRRGFRAAPDKLTRVYNGENVSLALDPSVDFSTNCRVLGVWCEAFDANFGDVLITRPPPRPSTPLLQAVAVNTSVTRPPGPSSCAAGGYAGFTGDLSMLEHGLSGRVEVRSSCQINVRGFSYDGQAPAAYWWCSTSSDYAAMKKGFRAAPMRLVRAYNQEEVNLTLVPAANLDTNCRVLAVWCEEFEANFGDVLLQKPSQQSPGGAMNCKDLIPGKLQIMWARGATGTPAPANLTVTLASSGLPPMSWSAFGFANPSARRSRMLGADVVVAGVLPGGAAFAVDYFLSDYEQCDYADTRSSGVCPDDGYGAGQPGGRGVNNAVPLSGVQQGGVRAVTFRRPATPGDRWDHAWPTGNSTAYAVFAYGPLAEASTAQLPIVLYHGPSSHSPTKFEFSFGQASNCSQPLIPTGGSTAPAPPRTSSAPPMRRPVSILDRSGGPATLQVSTGSNLNYPNPPAWGLSYHIDGQETPVLRLKRGVKYTFNITAGGTHPLYMTDDVIGGARNANETVYAGGAFSHGTPGKPYLLEWTPPASAPDTLYYQCHTHQKLGWKVDLSAAGAGMAPAAASGARPAAPLALMGMLLLASLG